MSAAHLCPNCGSELSSEMPAGLCQRCLFELGLQSDAKKDNNTTEMPAEFEDSDFSGRIADGKIGPYRIRHLVGEGGMGLVYLAEQKEPIRRRVALKIIKLGMDTREVIARFESERQALALMNHPNIARVLDAGVTQEGRPYFVMDYVAGIPITDYCDKHRLNTRQRLQLFSQVCEAIQHAHQKGIIHRDIKPSNILVEVRDGKAIPKVIDFGVAKAIEQRLTEKTLFTQRGVLIGTSAYMSPEQVEMSELEVDTTTDIYSLGVLLYELLVGALPFDSRALRQAGFDEMRRIIREEDPPTLSTRLSSLGDQATQIARRRQSDLSSLAKQLRGELDWITLKALEKDRTRRYPSASEFAFDVRRYLEDEPVVAGPPGAAYRLRKVIKKHRVPILAVCFVLLIALAGFAISTVLYFQAETAREEANRQKIWAQKESYRANLSAADMQLSSNNVDTAQEFLDRCEPELRNWEWWHLFYRSDCSEMELAAYTRIHHFPFLGSSFIFSLSGDRVSWNSEFAVHSWDLRTGLPLETIGGFGSILAVSPDGSRALCTKNNRGAGELGVFEISSGTTVTKLNGLSSTAGSARFGPDGSRIAVGEEDGRIRIWETESGNVLLKLKGHKGRVEALAFSSNGRLIASGSDDGAVRIWETKRGALRHVMRGHTSSVASLEFSPDQTLLASGSRDTTVRIWGVENGEPRHTLEGHQGPVYSLAFSPKGSLLATGSQDRTVRRWDMRTGELVATIPTTHSFGLYSLSFTPDGEKILTASSAVQRSWINVWQTNIHAGYRTLTHSPGNLTEAERWESSPDAIAFSLDSSLIVSAGGANLRLWDVDLAEELTHLEIDNDRILSVSFSPKGDRILFGTQKGDVGVWDPRSGEVLQTLSGHTDQVSSVSYSPDGSLIATASFDKTIRLWDGFTGKPIRDIELPDRVNSIAFSSNGLWLVSGSGDTRSSQSNNSTIRIWDVVTGEELVSMEDVEPVPSVTFSPDNLKVISAAAARGEVRVWNASTGVRLGIAQGTPVISSLAISPDGTRIIANSWLDRLIYIWDSTSLELLLTLGGYKEAPGQLVFSPDGSRIASASSDGTVRIWDSRSSYHPDAEELVTSLRGERDLSAETANTIRADDSLDEELRLAALTMVQRQGDNPNRLYQASLKTVESPDETPDSYERALKFAMKASELFPWEADYAMCIGAAHYRLAQYDEALKALESAHELNRGKHSNALAFEAMTHFQMGRLDQAKDLFEELKELMNQNRHEKRRLTEAIWAEVRSLANQ